MATPIASIVLPTYNRAGLIGRSLRSLLAQTVANFEILVVDDASDDETEEVVRAFQDPRIRYFRLLTNGGPAAACNCGVRQARGEFVSFQGSDDEWEPRKLEVQMEAFAGCGPDVAVVYCDMLRIPLVGEPSYHHSPAITRGRLLNRSTGFYQTYGLGSQATLIRRRLLDSPDCFDGRYRCFEDLELLLRLARRFEFVHIPEALVRYYESEDGLTRSFAYELAARKLLLRSNGWILARESPGFVLREGTFQIGVSWGGERARRRLADPKHIG